MNGWRWVVLAFSLLPFAAAAENLYVGWGLGSTRPPEAEENVSTLQLFAGYRFRDSGDFDPRLTTMAWELGHNATDDGRYDGGWTTFVMNHRIARHLDLMGRLGIDVGDEPSILGGIGVVQHLERNMAVRLELQRRFRVSTLLVNLVYYPKWWR